MGFSDQHEASLLNALLKVASPSQLAGQETGVWLVKKEDAGELTDTAAVVPAGPEHPFTTATTE